MSAFDAAGVKVYALSYDEQAALLDYQRDHAVTFRLLSDPNSEVIRDFGILNTLIDEHDHPWFGIPFPGTYLLDSSGTITHKFFENNLAVRVGPEQLLTALRGELDLEALPVSSTQDDQQTEVEIFFAGENLALSVQRDLVARFSVPAGRHLYASPAPEGSVAVSIELDDHPSLVQRDVQVAEGEQHALAGTSETFLVHHDDVTLRLPITINGPVAGESVKLSGSVRWQTCDDTLCDVPQTQRFEIDVPVVNPAAASIRGASDGSDTPESRTAAHFQYMIERRKT